MEKIHWTPFIRNRYFNGKLLTAEDLKEEQEYLGAKRRMLSRYFFGAGIAAGLEVIPADDYSISVEKGMALDASGREITVESPVIVRLSELDGFEEAAEEEGLESMYLCIEYREEAIEPVHNLGAAADSKGNGMEYNKISEGYRLYVTDDEPAVMELPVTDGKEEDWNGKRPDQIERGLFQKGVYLARIELVKADPFYMIDGVDFSCRTYLGCQPLFKEAIKALGDRAVRIEERLQRVEEAPWRKRQAEREQGILAEPEETSPLLWQMSEGQVMISVKGGKREQCFFSGEIPHGLGLGNVQIHTRLLWGDCLYSGAEDIFLEEQVPAAVGVKVNRSKGTFEIGLRLLEDAETPEIQVGWTAMRNRRRNEVEEGEKRLFIKPSMVNMKVLETFELGAVCLNVGKGEHLEWKVLTPEGGSVDENGLYRSPARAGVYQVGVCLQDNPQVKASVFIVVRN